MHPNIPQKSRISSSAAIGKRSSISAFRKKVGMLSLLVVDADVIPALSKKQSRDNADSEDEDMKEMDSNSFLSELGQPRLKEAANDMICM